MGSLASIVNPRTYHRSSSVSAAGSASLNGRPRSLHLPVTQTLSASSMISPVLSVATRAINNNNNNHLPCVEAGQLSSGSSLHLPYPPLIFPAAEFAPGNHVLQGRSPASNNAKGEPFSRVLDHFSLYSCVNALTWKLEKCPPLHTSFYLLLVKLKIMDLLMQNHRKRFEFNWGYFWVRILTNNGCFKIHPLIAFVLVYLSEMHLGSPPMLLKRQQPIIISEFTSFSTTIAWCGCCLWGHNKSKMNLLLKTDMIYFSLLFSMGTEEL